MREEVNEYLYSLQQWWRAQVDMCLFICMTIDSVLFDACCQRAMQAELVIMLIL